ncbi:MAG: nucleotide exchange factor GrpE [candidate division WOR-3 bacterium]|nr:nucleotide exchange factor GrpE [candidate division WOR-3 bacterium]MCX7947240.1 nucleotide exchange factor GrpE [candidate division WOR-3 bacterium]MDW8150295.1 nucleotide exchange factor GrpE [candidate division WOR-3 bacterium]
MIFHSLLYRKLLNRLKKSNNELTDLKERYVRLLSDLENYKKTVSRKASEEKEIEKEKIFKEIILIVDNFDRALDFIKKSNGNDDIKKGVEMIYKQLIGFLNNNGIEQISFKGKSFDPKLCEALVVKEGDEDNIVVEEFEKAYVYKGKVLKPAKVAVSKKITS